MTSAQQMFAGIPCREQVFWITTAASGAFLPGLSAPGRIVITATMAGQESNETEFPHALAEVCRMEPSDSTRTAMARLPVWEVFLRTTEAVDARFQRDQRSPTEHALLDDNGDRKGTERPEKGGPAGKAGEPKQMAHWPGERSSPGRRDRLPVKLVYLVVLHEKLDISAGRHLMATQPEQAQREPVPQEVQAVQRLKQARDHLRTSMAQVVVGQDDVLDLL